MTSGEGASREVAAFLLDAQYGSLAGTVHALRFFHMSVVNVHIFHAKTF